MAAPTSRPRNNQRQKDRKHPRKRHREYKDVPEVSDNEEEAAATATATSASGATTEGGDAIADGSDFVSLDSAAAEKGAGKGKKRKRGEDGEEGEGKNGKDGKSSSKNKKRKEKRHGDVADGAAAGEGEGATAGGAGNSNARFIVFVGNLPYDTTQASLATHFAPVKPSSIRVATHKPGTEPGRKGKGRPGKPTNFQDAASGEAETPKCKGYAFVEFSDAGRMKTCLTTFHHSLFNGRKINVELTAGGGGSSEGRKEKVRVKNEKLNEERKKKFEEEQKKKTEAKKKAEAEGGAEGKEAKQQAEEADDGIHPSRRRRMKK